MNFTSNYLSCEGREVHYTEWGAGHAETVIAWHGLARTGRDMDELAVRLSGRYRVLCPDTVGRGLSQWSPLPEQEYCLDFYSRQAAALMDSLGVRAVHWVGTSMGGALGIRLAAGALRGRIRRLVLNDVGPQLGAAAVARIRAYAGSPPQFDRVSELEQYFRTIYQPFGALTDEQWRRLAESSTRRTAEGRVTPHYDPKMVLQFERHPHDYDQWEAWDAIDVPTLCLTGSDSPGASREVTRRLTKVLPSVTEVEIAGVGHMGPVTHPERINALIERHLETN